VDERVIEDPALRQRFSFRTTVDDDGGEVLHVETWVDPGGGVTPHIHPAIEERFEVLEGRPSFLAGRKGVDALLPLLARLGSAVAIGPGAWLSIAR
jgi:hypothetical protein